MKLNVLLLSIGLLMTAACSQSSSQDTSDEPTEPSINDIKTQSLEVSKPQPDAPAVKLPALKTPPPAELEKRGAYWVDVARDCDGYPRMNLSTPAGLCIGLVASKETPSKDGKAGLKFPRDILIPHPDDTFSNEIYVTDMGGWAENRGRLLLINDGQIETVLEGLNLPHAIEYGPDGGVYIAETDKINRVYIPPSRYDGFGTNPIITNLPYKTSNKLHLHPLKAFSFLDTNTILVNSGSVSDRCEKFIQKGVCEEPNNTGAVLKFVKDGQRWTLIETDTAKGLRNSMGLTTHASGTVLQAGNGSDYKDPNSPHEDLNVINEGQFYGWPYCYDQDSSDPDWAGSAFDCTTTGQKHSPPIRLLPPHGAPLDLLYAPKGTLGFKSEKLIVPLHGHRKTGHRILMFDVDAKGLPNAEAVELVSEWAAQETGPRGAPVGLTVGHDGSIWGVEDKNKTIFRIAKDAYKPARWGKTPSHISLKDDGTYAALQASIFLKNCASCHEEFSGAPNRSLNTLAKLGWLDEESAILDRVLAKPPKRMPPAAPLSDPEIQKIKQWLTK